MSTEGFFLNYLIFASILAAIYTVGRIVTFFISVKQKETSELFYVQVFNNMLIGLVAVITIYSLLKTGFISINLVFVVIGLLILYEHYKFKGNTELQPLTVPVSKNTKLKRTRILLLSSVIVFSWEVFLFHGENIGGDAVFYARISHFLNITGEENEFHVYNLLDKDYHGASPYHFFELWFTAIVSTVFGGKAIFNYTFLYPVTFNFLFYIGILALWNKLYKVNWTISLLSLFLLFSGGLVLGIYNNIPFLAEGEYFGYSIMLANIKFNVFYLFIIAFFLSILRGTMNIGILILLCLPVTSIVVFPAVIGGLLVYFVFGLILKKYSPKDLSRPFLYVALIPLSLFLFYYFFGNEDIQRGSVSAGNLISILSDLFGTDHLKTRVNIFGSTVLRFGVYYLPFFVIAVLFFKYIPKEFEKSGKLIFMVSLCVVLTALFGWSLLYEDLGAVQVFFSNTPFLNCLQVFVGIILISQLTKEKHMFYKKIALSGTILIILISGGSQAWKDYELSKNLKISSLCTDNFYEEIKKAFASKEIGPLGGSYKAPEDYATQPFSYVNHGYVLGDYLSQIDNSMITISLSDYNVVFEEDPLTLNRQKQYVALGIFYRYVEKQKREKLFISIENSLRNFLQEFQLSFIIASEKAVLPKAINELVKREIKDEVSGSRFIILKNIKHDSKVY